MTETDYRLYTLTLNHTEALEVAEALSAQLANDARRIVEEADTYGSPATHAIDRAGLAAEMGVIAGVVQRLDAAMVEQLPDDDRQPNGSDDT